MKQNRYIAFLPVLALIAMLFTACGGKPAGTPISDTPDTDAPVLPVGGEIPAYRFAAGQFEVDRDGWLDRLGIDKDDVATLDQYEAIAERMRTELGATSSCALRASRYTSSRCTAPGRTT